MSDAQWVPKDHIGATEVYREGHAEGYRQGLEVLAAYYDERGKDEYTLSNRYRSGSTRWFAHIQRAEMHRLDAAAIRAMLENKP